MAGLCIVRYKYNCIFKTGNGRFQSQRRDTSQTNDIVIISQDSQECTFALSGRINRINL